MTRRPATPRRLLVDGRALELEVVGRHDGGDPTSVTMPMSRSNAKGSYAPAMLQAPSRSMMEARRMSAADILRSVGYRTDSSYNLSYP